MPKMIVNGKEVEFESGMTVMQVCEQAGAEIPRFCYHERLSIAGNCRMCLVELKNAPKPIASCAFPAGDGMEVSTQSDLVQKARKGVMEFLLINHPLDCPICDQGGECDLQDQAMAFGFDRSRFQEEKRAVTDKYIGPLIGTVMTRCIQCTRCVRFMTEVAGSEDIGLLNRGEKVEISTIEKAVNSELSGNLADICPVGALTHKPTAFSVRPWELTKTETIDVLDAVGTNISVEVRGDKIIRVEPRLNEAVNEEWLADKGRYAIDGLKRQRLDRPYIRKDGKLQEASWEDALSLVAQKLTTTAPDKMAALSGDLVDVESLFAFKTFLTDLGVTSLDCRQDGAKLDPSSRANYLLNTGIEALEEADAILLVGTNPRLEAPLVNTRLRKAVYGKGAKVAVLGPEVDLTYAAEFLGNDLSQLDSLGTFEEVLAKAEKPLILLGAGATTGPRGGAVAAKVQTLAKKLTHRDNWNGFGVLHHAAARVGGLDLGFVPSGQGLDRDSILEQAAQGNLDFLYLLGADEIPVSEFKDCFIVYQGHHGDRGAHGADVIFPTPAYTEKTGLYVNTEGRVQCAQQVVDPLGEAKEDWKVFAALAQKLNKEVPYISFEALRAALIEAYPHFEAWGEIKEEAVTLTQSQEVGTLSGSFKLPIQNYYMTDPISRASEVMANCADVYVKKETQEEALS